MKKFLCGYYKFKKRTSKPFRKLVECLQAAAFFSFFILGTAREPYPVIYAILILLGVFLISFIAFLTNDLVRASLKEVVRRVDTNLECYYYNRFKSRGLVRARHQ